MISVFQDVRRNVSSINDSSMRHKLKYHGGFSILNYCNQSKTQGIWPKFNLIKQILDIKYKKSTSS